MRQFSPPHLAAMAVMVLAIAVVVPLARRFPGRWTDFFAWGLAGLIFAAWAGEYVADVIVGTWSVRYTLPLQLTDAISVTAMFALVLRRRFLVELVLFWSLSAALQAVITPDLAYDFPSVFFFTYFIYHEGSILAGLLLVFGLRQYPRPWAALRVFAATLAWAAVAGTGDVLTGGNYMYLAQKPVHTSLLSVLGPWPWYIASAAGVAVILLLLIAGITAGLKRLLDPASAAESDRFVDPTLVAGRTAREAGCDVTHARLTQPHDATTAEPGRDVGGSSGSDV